MTVKDQYGDVIPFEHLVCMPNPEHVNDDDIETILDGRWYEINGQLFLHYKDAPDYVETPPPFDKDEINSANKIATCLNRVDYSGFYHA